MGAMNIKYKHYLFGSVLGLLPSALSFSIMGMSAEDPSSPAFVLSVAAEIGLILLSVSILLILKRKKKKKTLSIMKMP